MRNTVALLFSLITLSSAGQDLKNLKKIVNSFKIPDGWKSEMILDTSYAPLFGKKMIAKWRFVCTKVKIQPVELIIFNYKPEDSATMTQKAMMYYATSNCLVASNENMKQNSMDFARGDFYFVEKMCPCYTTGSEQCRTFVRALNDWITNRDKTKEF
jgi:hypothetical protein